MGYCSDKYDSRVGKRTPWYIAGIVLLVVAYFMTFDECVFCLWAYGRVDWHEECPALLTFYYVIFPILLNFGWACV